MPRRPDLDKPRYRRELPEDDGTFSGRMKIDWNEMKQKGQAKRQRRDLGDEPRQRRVLPDDEVSKAPKSKIDPEEKPMPYVGSVPLANPRHEFFVHEYMKDFNATQAALRCGYSEGTVAQIGWQLLQMPSIRGRLDYELAEINDKKRVEVADIRAELVRMALFDAGEFAKYTIRCPADIAKLPRRLRSAITGWRWVKDRFEITLAKTAAMEMLGKHLAMFVERREHTGKDGGAIKTETMLTVEDLDKYDDADFAKLYREKVAAPH